MKNNNSKVSLKRGRPPKKDYDSEALMQELINTVAEIYKEKKEIKATALELSLPPNKVKIAMSKTPHIQYLCGFARHGNEYYGAAGSSAIIRFPYFSYILI